MYQPVGALADPVHLIEQAVADQVAPVQLGIVVPAGVFWRGPAPQLAQLGIQLVQVRAGCDLVHPRRGESRRGRQRADRDSLRAGRGQCPGAFRPACSRRHAARDTRRSTCRSRRQAAIRSVIVTMTPLQVFSERDGQRRFVAPLLPAPPG